MQSSFHTPGAGDASQVSGVGDSVVEKSGGGKAQLDATVESPGQFEKPLTSPESDNRRHSSDGMTKKVSTPVSIKAQLFEVSIKEQLFDAIDEVEKIFGAM